MTEAEELELLELEAEEAKFQSERAQEQPQEQPQAQPPMMLDGVSGAGEQVGISPEMASAPLTSQLPQDASLGQRITAGATDVLTTPLSAVYAAGVTPGSGQSFWQNLYNIKQGRNPFTGEEALPEQLISDPANVLIPAGAKLYRGGQKLTGMAIKSPIAQKIFGSLLGGAGEGAISATAHQAEKVARGEDVDLGEGGLEIGVSAALPTALKGTLGFINKSMGAFAEQLSGAMEEGLRKYGFGFGKGSKELVETVAKRDKIGEQFLERIDNWKDYTPEGPMLDNIASEMPTVQTTDVLDEIQRAISKVELKETNKPIVAKLEKIYKDVSGLKTLPDVVIKGKSKVYGKSGIPSISSKKRDPITNLPLDTYLKSEKPFARVAKGKEIIKDEMSANKLWKIRQELDDLVNWTDPGAKKLDQLISNIRFVAEEQLESGAEQIGKLDDYLALKMKYGQKKALKDKILAKIGKTGDKDRANVFFANLFGQNKEGRQELVQELSGLFGEDFTRKAKILQLGKSLGPEGKPTILPRQTTGRATLPYDMAQAASTGGFESRALQDFAKAGFFGMGSPMVASKALRLADLMGEGYKKVPGELVKQPLRTLTFRDMVGE